MAKSRRSLSRQATYYVTALLLFVVGCSGDDDARTPTAAESTTSVFVEDSAASQDSADGAPPEPLQLAETNQFNLLSPGSYVSDLLSLEVAMTTTTEFNVTSALPGSIVIESPASTNDEYFGVGLFVVDTLLDSERSAEPRSRLPASLDLSEFLSSRDAVEVTSTREDTLGGLPARVWRIEYTEPCDDCWFQPLFSRPGWVNLWGTFPGIVMDIWTVEAPGSPIIVTVEAPEEQFEAWDNEVQEQLFKEMHFGEPTGFSLERPTGAFAAGFGEYATGRMELEVVDTSRPTIEINNDAGLSVSADDARTLLLSIAYPSDAGGFGAAPADGLFPLVVVAPALHDAGSILPADRQLASHGFVVVAVRFPESSFPGSGVVGVREQPADISFVVDEIQRSELPGDLAAVTDLNRIGLLGHSAGATTAFGLLAYECCQDDRFDAIVAHAGTPFDFDSVQVASTTPILHLVSNADQVSPVEAVREFHRSTDGPTFIAELEFASHLGWLHPETQSYDDAFRLVLAFLDEHLRDRQTDLAALISESAFVRYSED